MTCAFKIINMTVQFSSNEAVSLEKQIENSTKRVQTKPESIDSVYEIPKCVEWIQNHNFKKVCLQFPDYLLPDSSEIAMRLQSILDQTVYIMGDTAYESCCIDYVAAAHVNVDAIIHFGPVCFSKASDNIPCLSIYEKEPLDICHFKETVNRKFCECSDQIAVVVDTPFIVHLDLIRQAFKEHRMELYPVDTENMNLMPYVTVFIGGNQRKLMNLRFSYKPKELYYYDPETQLPELINYEEDSKVLKRRYFLVEKIKDSDTIGIIIGTLAVRNYLRVIERIKKLIQASGKKYYIISVGKPTVAKLANFPEVDIYVVITCAMNEIYDSREFYQPIVTPFDVELALNPDANSEQFAYDFNAYLPDSDFNQSDLEYLSRNRESDVSLITGKVRTFKSEVEEETVASENTQIALRTEGTIAVNTNFGAGFLSERSWKGLEQNLGQDKPELAQEGRRGIAQGYANEKL